MGIREWVTGKPEERSGPFLGLGDSALAEWLGIAGNGGVAGVAVTDVTALGITAFWRAVNLIAGTIAGLPLKAYEGKDATRREVDSWLDDIANPYPIVPFTAKQMMLGHMLVRGETFLRHTYNGADALIGVWPIHPSAVKVTWAGTSKEYEVTFDGGDKKVYTPETMTQVMGLTLDGLRGISVLSLLSHPISVAIANERAAGRQLGNGVTVGGLVTTGPDEDVDEDEAKVIQSKLRAKLTGVDNAGDIAFVNRHLVFDKWTQTNVDAQFHESREFAVTEISRITGVPPHLLSQTEKQTSWGTGVAEQNLGLSRFTLMSWTSPLQQAFTRLLPEGQFCEFDYAGLLQGTPQQEIELLLAQVAGGILTEDEARAIRNMGPKPKTEEPATRPVVVQDDQQEVA